jgi:hypothetical protein
MKYTRAFRAALFGAVLCSQQHNAHAQIPTNAELDAVDRKAAAYFAGQPVEPVGGYTPMPRPGAVSASVPYEQEYIGVGVDLVTGEPRKGCLLTEAMDTLSVALGQPDSALSVVQSDYDIETFLESITNVSASASVGSFAAQLSTAVGISREMHLTAHDYAVIAHYTFTLGKRWYNGSYTLDSKYDQLRQAAPDVFLARCGLGFLQGAENGIAATVVYHLHQRTETDASLDSIKAAFSVRYGLATVNGSEQLTDAQRQTLSAFEITSDCYAEGGTAATCAMLRDASTIEAIWTQLSGSFQPTDAVALKTSYMPYSEAFGDARLGIAADRVQLLKDWEQRRAWVASICNAAPYIPDCTPTKANIDAIEMRIDDPSQKDLPEPGFSDGFPVFLQADLGHVYLYEHINGGGRVLDLHFSLNPKDVDVYRSDVAYRLSARNFDQMVSSTKVQLEVPAHWVLELYSTPDGTGTPLEAGQSEGPINVPHDFNDQARSFRLRYVQ